MGDGPGRGSHPNSLANLKPFVGGGDPRRHVGAPSFGRQITSAMNELARTNEQGDAVYIESDLNEIIGNVRSSHARVIAAREILRARLGTFDKIGRIPQAANSLERIYDRTDGRPTQTIRLEAKTTRTAIEIKADIKALIVADPGIADLLRKTAEPVLDGLESSIETTVEVPEKKHQALTKGLMFTEKPGRIVEPSSGPLYNSLCGGQSQISQLSV